MFYKTRSVRQCVLAKKSLFQQENSRFFHLYAFSFTPFLEQHLHFAPLCLSILVASSCFLKPNYLLFAPKNLLFNGYFTLLSHFFNGSKRLCLYHCSGCLCLSSRNQQHFALRLAAFYLAFSTKTHCVQHQNAPRLAPKCSIFSTKQPEIQCKLRLFEINIHFAGIYNCSLFASKPTFARIDFLRQGWRLVEKKPLIMLKYMLKSGQQLGVT